MLKSHKHSHKLTKIKPKSTKTPSKHRQNPRKLSNPHKSSTRFNSTATFSSPSQTQIKNNAQKIGGHRVLPIKVLNTLTNQLEHLTIRDSTPLDPSFSSKHLSEGYQGALKWYVCGPTVYDASHIGHARTYTNFDMMRRILSHYHQIPLVFAMGVTDIDDKIINRSREKKLSWLTLARHWEHEFNSDLQTLNILPPDMSLRVSEFIPDIIDYVQQLTDRGLAYTTSDGVYFDVSAFSQRGHLYGKLRYSTLQDAARHVQEALASLDTSLFDEDASQPKKIEQTQGPDQTDTSSSPSSSSSSSPSSQPIGHAEKRHPADFCLWKFQKSPYEPAFESQFGVGRPGWHIECSAITASALGTGLDVHSGGVDLKFPHHCNEIAQAEGCLGWGQGHLADFGTKSLSETNPTPDPDPTSSESVSNVGLKANWTSTWLHTGHLNIQGLKMSKSLKNFITIKQLFTDGYSADEFRMLCATAPYGSTLDYAPVRLEQCREEIKNVRNFKEIIKRTLLSTTMKQIDHYNTTIGAQQLELDHDGNIVIVGAQGNGEKVQKNEQSEQKSVKNNIQNDQTPTIFPTIASADYSLSQPDTPAHYSKLESVYLDQSMYIRPSNREKALEQFFLNTQGSIHQFLSTDFNTQQTISALSVLISQTTRYIAEKNEAGRKGGERHEKHSPPSSFLLSQISTYVSKIYNILGFQFAGAIGGDWDLIGTRVEFVTHKLLQKAHSNGALESQTSVQYTQDGVPVFLHELAAQRYQLKQNAVQGGKIQKKIQKILKQQSSTTPQASSSSAPAPAPAPAPTDTITLDKAVFDELMTQLKKSNETVLGVCDHIRDQVFSQAGFSLKDLASSSGSVAQSGNGGAGTGATAGTEGVVGTNVKSTYFIAKIEQGM